MSLLDPDLVSLAARLPLLLKHRTGTTKWILRKAMEPWLPRDVVYWPKTGFGVPLRKWSHSELRDVMEDTLSASRLKSRGLYDPSAVTS